MEFQVFVKPVGSRCNLSCDYCYYHGNDENHTHEKGYLMDRGLLERYIQQHLKAEKGDTIMFSWHGGEPLLAGIGFYADALRLQEKHNTEGKRIINGIQTNGILLDENWCRFLAANNFIVGLSIDGPPEFHDMHRVTRSGKPTSAQVNKAWDLLREHGIIYELLCVVGDSNVEYPLDIYNFFSQGNAEYITFLPLVEKAGFDGASRDSVDPVKFGKFMIAIFDIWKKEGIGKIKIQLFEEALRSSFGQDHTLCIFKRECGGVPLLEADGNFYTCDHYASSEYLVGNILKSPLSSLLDSKMQKDFGSLKAVSLPRYCLECEVLDICNGECPRNRFMSTPDGEPGLNFLCPGYRMLFNHIRPFAVKVAEAWKKRPV